MQLREQHLYYHDKLLPVSRILPHPNYYTAQSGADIALLELEDPVNISSHVQLVTLPPASETFPVGTQCWVTGWGNLENGGKHRGQREGVGELGPEAPGSGCPAGTGSPRAGSGRGSLASPGGGEEVEEAGCAQHLCASVSPCTKGHSHSRCFVDMTRGKRAPCSEEPHY